MGCIIRFAGTEILQFHQPSMPLRHAALTKQWLTWAKGIYTLYISDVDKVALMEARVRSMYRQAVRAVNRFPLEYLRSKLKYNVRDAININMFYATTLRSDRDRHNHAEHWFKKGEAFLNFINAWSHLDDVTRSLVEKTIFPSKNTTGSKTKD